MSNQPSRKCIFSPHRICYDEADLIPHRMCHLYVEARETFLKSKKEEALARLRDIDRFFLQDKIELEEYLKKKRDILKRMYFLRLVSIIK